MEVLLWDFVICCAMLPWRSAVLFASYEEKVGDACASMIFLRFA
jgi:hypothetical protein